MSVWQRQRNWWNEVLWKPKKPLSLEQLKFQYQVLTRNPTVTEGNKNLLVETFRSIAEILIWGDQNDSRVFDYFLEKNMQSLFQRTLSQKCGRFVVLQLLQTMSILFENIRNETSLYYLLSNNHINSIIVLKLDFSDEEVLAYYISFLKTLSFKLNKHTIHFFYNENLRDFPLYTEAIKFFNHSESMVRIAVRTLTLNVYKVDDEAMLQYIINKTAAPYFSNLVWFIGNHIIELDECLQSQAHHLNRGRLEMLVAEHLDHLHYVNDIMSLGVGPLNEVLIDHLLNRLLIPLYVYSLTDQVFAPEGEESPRISSKISLFLLSQVFLILTNDTVVTNLAYLILTGDTSLTLPPSLQHPSGHKREGSYSSIRAFAPPEASLDTSLQRAATQAKAAGAQPVHVHAKQLLRKKRREEGGEGSSTESQSHMHEVEGAQYIDTVVDAQYVLIEASPSSKDEVNTPPHPSASSASSSSSSSASKPQDYPLSPPSPSHPTSSLPPTSPSPQEEAIPGMEEEEQLEPIKTKDFPTHFTAVHNIPISSTIFLDSLMGALSVRSDDSRCLFSLCLLYAMMRNEGIHPKLMEAFSLKATPSMEQEAPQCNSELVCLLLSILDTATATSNSIRLVTLHLAILLLRELSFSWSGVTLQPQHIALVSDIYEAAVIHVKLFYKGSRDEIFLDMFENQFTSEKSFQVKVDYLLMDASMLLPPTDTPLTGIEFTRRLPCGETERVQKAMRVFFAIRLLTQQLSGTAEMELPLTLTSNSASVGQVVDLNNCNLVLCQVITGEKVQEHFLVITDTELILVVPDKSKMGCGIVQFIAFLQDIDITPDPADSSALFITVHSHNQKRPALSAKLQFEDHIRCVAARQLLVRSRDSLRLAKMVRVSKMLHLPPPEPLPRQLSASSVATPDPEPNTQQESRPSHLGLESDSLLSTSAAQKAFAVPPPPPSSSQEAYELSCLTPQSGKGAQSPQVELNLASLEVSLHFGPSHEEKGVKEGEEGKEEEGVKEEGGEREEEEEEEEGEKEEEEGKEEEGVKEEGGEREEEEEEEGEKEGVEEKPLIQFSPDQSLDTSREEEEGVEEKPLIQFSPDQSLDTSREEEEGVEEREEDKGKEKVEGEQRERRKRRSRQTSEAEKEEERELASV